MCETTFGGASHGRQPAVESASLDVECFGQLGLIGLNSKLRERGPELALEEVVYVLLGLPHVDDPNLPANFGRAVHDATGRSGRTHLTIELLVGLTGLCVGDQDDGHRCGRW